MFLSNELLTLECSAAAIFHFRTNLPPDVFAVGIAEENNVKWIHSKPTKSNVTKLQVYDLGPDGQGMVRVASVSQNAIVAAAGKIAR